MCQVTLEAVSSFLRPNVSPSNLNHTFPLSSYIQHQSIVLNLVFPKAHVPIETNMKEFEKDDLLIKFEEGEGEEVDMINILSRIFSLEKSQGDILTLL